MASIICGECRNRHASVAEVEACYVDAAQADEVCCYSCDALIGYGGPWIIDGERAGCGGPGICKRDFPATFGPGAYSEPDEYVPSYIY